MELEPLDADDAWDVLRSLDDGSEAHAQLCLYIANLEARLSGPPVTGMFKEFWDAYPRRNNRKLGKSLAMQKFSKLSVEDKRMAIVAAQNYAKTENVRRGYARDASRFLSNDYWKEFIDSDQKPMLFDLDVTSWRPE